MLEGLLVRASRVNAAGQRDTHVGLHVVDCNGLDGLEFLNELLHGLGVLLSSSKTGDELDLGQTSSLLSHSATWLQACIDVHRGIHVTTASYGVNSAAGAGLE